jgi:hypothetical protein
MRPLSLLCAILSFAMIGALPARAESPAWPPADLAALESACQRDPGIQAMVSDAPVGQPPAIQQFCTCFVSTLSDVDADDAAILTRDLLGTATDAERQAHDGYAALSGKASRALARCQANRRTDLALSTPTPTAPGSEAVAAAEPAPAAEAAPAPNVTTAEVSPVPATRAIPPVTPAPVPAPAPGAPATPDRMSSEAASFLTSCASSTPFKDYLDHLGEENSAQQGTICACLTGALVTKVSDTDFPVLARDFGMSSAQSSATTTTAAGGAARDSLRLCMRGSGITPDF